MDTLPHIFYCFFFNESVEHGVDLKLNLRTSVCLHLTLIDIKDILNSVRF